MTSIERAITDAVQVRVDIAMKKVHQSMKECAIEYAEKAVDQVVHEIRDHNKVAEPDFGNRVGHYWSDDEDCTFIKEIHETLEETAKKHGRNFNGMFARLKKVIMEHKLG